MNLSEGGLLSLPIMSKTRLSRRTAGLNLFQLARQQFVNLLLSAQATESTKRVLYVSKGSLSRVYFQNPGRGGSGIAAELSFGLRLF